MKRHALEDAVSADLVPVEVVLNSLKQEILTIMFKKRKKKKNQQKQTSKQTFKILAVFWGRCGVGVGWYNTHWYLM